MALKASIDLHEHDALVDDAHDVHAPHGDVHDGGDASLY